MKKQETEKPDHSSPPDEEAKEGKGSSKGRKKGRPNPSSDD